MSSLNNIEIFVYSNNSEDDLYDVNFTNVGDNQVSYRGLYQGEEYDPSVTDPDGYLPEIKLRMWIVIYQAQ